MQRRLLLIVSLRTLFYFKLDSFSLLPSNVKQISFIQFKRVFDKSNELSNNPFQLTHLTVIDSFKVFPYNLFDLKQLEYLKIRTESYADYSLMANRCCNNLKYLSIQSIYLIPLLTNFKQNFPQIETLDVSWAHWKNFNSHLKTIISSETLKCLEIEYYESKKCSLDIETELKSSIEELTLKFACWELVSDLLEVERFPCLRKIYFEKRNQDWDLDAVFKKLNAFPQLTSLTLIGEFYCCNEQLPYKFENLKYFCLGVTKTRPGLELLLSCMPNLIEFQVREWHWGNLTLPNPVGIRYFTLPFEYFKHNEDFINIVKNTPNLIQLRRIYGYSNFQSVSFGSELAFYFQKLKEYFDDELQFEINSNCFPIMQLMKDDKLLQLVWLKSPELKSYLNCIFPIETFKPFVKQFFVIDYERHFNAKSINDDWTIKFFNLLSDLKIDRNGDVFHVREILFRRKKESSHESIDFSVDNFYKLFSYYFDGKIQINFESVHLEFVVEYLKTNKKYGLSKVYKFLEFYFISLSVINGQSKTVNEEIFNFFSRHLCAPSFRLLFDKIKNNNFNEREKKFLPLNLEPIAENLRNLDLQQYEELSINFKDIVMKLYDGSFVQNFFDILKVASIPESKCVICLDLLFANDCKFFESESGSCYLFHKDCLIGWQLKNFTCPQCRKPSFLSSYIRKCK